MRCLPSSVCLPRLFRISRLYTIVETACDTPSEHAKRVFRTSFLCLFKKYQSQRYPSHLNLSIISPCIGIALLAGVAKHSRRILLVTNGCFCCISHPTSALSATYRSNPVSRADQVSADYQCQHRSSFSSFGSCPCSYVFCHSSRIWIRSQWQWQWFQFW